MFLTQSLCYAKHAGIQRLQAAQPLHAAAASAVIMIIASHEFVSRSACPAGIPSITASCYAALQPHSGNHPLSVRQMMPTSPSVHQASPVEADQIVWKPCDLSEHDSHIAAGDICTSKLTWQLLNASADLTSVEYKPSAAVLTLPQLPANRKDPVLLCFKLPAQGALLLPILPLLVVLNRYTTK